MLPEKIFSKRFLKVKVTLEIELHFAKLLTYLMGQGDVNLPLLIKDCFVLFLHLKSQGAP